MAALPVAPRNVRYANLCDVPGFGVQLQPAGSRLYVLRYRNAAGIERQYTIGQCPAMKAADAVAEAERLRAKLATDKAALGTALAAGMKVDAAGVADPLAARRKVAVKGDTLESIIADYLASPKGAAKLRHPERVKRDLDRLVPVGFRHRAVADVRRRDIAALVDKVAGATRSRRSQWLDPRLVARVPMVLAAQRR